MAIRLLTKKPLHPDLTSTRAVFFLLCRTFSSQVPSFKLDTHFRHLTPEDISPKTDYEIAGRKWLPGSKGKGFPKYLRKPREGFPYGLEVVPGNNHDLNKWAQIIRQVIDDNLSKYGTMLIRGLPLVESKAISEFSKALGYEAMSYPGGGVADRDLRDADAMVYTASEEPPEFTIELHNELSYLPTYPRKVIYAMPIEESLVEGNGLDRVKENHLF